MEEILKIEKLKIYYKNISGLAKAVDGVSLNIYPNEILGIAGESGSGKTTMVNGLVRLVKPPAYIADGNIILNYNKNGNLLKIDLLKVPEDEMRNFRWSVISYIPQGSMNSLNPVLKIRDQIIDVVVEHSGKSREEAESIIPSLLRSVNLEPSVADMYPHELSGGMKQRVIIAMALALDPKVVIADEPTTALDVVSQLSVLSTLYQVCRRVNASLVLVTHDMAVHAQLTDRVAIMYAGKVVEVGKTNEVFKKPLHPYTKALLLSIPTIEGKRRRLEGISGLAPSPTNWPKGCRFNPRCPYSKDICTEREPEEIEYEPGHYVSCFLYGGE
ncbi:MAG: ABC transporter ATP-binding protein [bacterium]